MWVAKPDLSKVGETGLTDAIRKTGGAPELHTRHEAGASDGGYLKGIVPARDVRSRSRRA